MHAHDITMPQIEHTAEHPNADTIEGVLIRGGSCFQATAAPSCGMAISVHINYPPPPPPPPPPPRIVLLDPFAMLV